MGTAVNSVCGCESGSVMAKEEDEMAKWQRWEHGGGGAVIKYFPHPFAFEGFWETIPAICVALNSPTWLNGP